MKKNDKKIRIVHFDDEIQIIETPELERHTLDWVEMDDFEERIEKRYREHLNFYQSIINSDIKTNENVSYEELRQRITKNNELLKLMLEEQED